jgi:hypothetical protein
MKVFDWKRRTGTYEESAELMLHNLKPAPGSTHRKIRKCRGMGSGKGGPGGFGMRGQNSRGGRPTRPGFEGGQTPLYRRIPKLRGQPMGPGHTKLDYGLIKVRTTPRHAALQQGLRLFAPSDRGPRVAAMHADHRIGGRPLRRDCAGRTPEARSPLE